MVWQTERSMLLTRLHRDKYPIQTTEFEYDCNYADFRKFTCTLKLYRYRSVARYGYRFGLKFEACGLTQQEAFNETVERALEVIDRVGQDVHPPKQGTIEDLERYKERIEGALLERFGKTKDSTEDIKSILREEEKKKGRDEGARGKDDELVVGKEDGKDTTA